MASLLGGRNLAPLTDRQISRAVTTILAFDNTVAYRYEAQSQTRFVVKTEEEEEYGEVIFSEDLYPGTNIANANAALSMPAAVAHELTHHHRWRNMRELDGEGLRNLDEALTSLEAAQLYSKQLSDREIQELIADACERLRLHLQG
jgi:uncharacterized protein YjaZ